MKFRSLMTAICVMATANIVSAAPFAYVANSGTKNVSVIDTADDTIKATIDMWTVQTPNPYPYGVAVGSSGQNVYVGLQDTNQVAVIDAATNSIVKMIGLGGDVPSGLAVNDAETRLYVTSNLSNTLIVIDISNGGAAEVGRVTVDDSTISNPSGVVLNSAGTKAYVANNSTSNVAVVDIDEANNVYAKSSSIALGNQPVGLALSSDGNTLYASSLIGNVRAIKLEDNTVYNLKDGVGDPAAIGNGNLALVVNAAGNKVYAPSNSTDKLFAIDSSTAPNIVVGTDYPVAAGPYGISITPDGSKLYMTMNTASAGETVKVFSTASNTVTGTIALPTLAKPTSFGNFIGPVFPFTITSSDDNTNCAISPEGVIPVNAKGRTFNITAISGNCDVKVDNVSVGQPSAYTFSGVTANQTISATPIAGTYYTVSGDWITNVGAFVESTSDPGINSASKSAKFLSGTVLTLKASSGFAVKSGTWGGACAGQGATCTLTVDGDKSFGTNVQFVTAPAGGPFYNVTKATFYPTWAECAAAASDNDYIKVSSAVGILQTDRPAGGLNVRMGNQWLEPDHANKDTYKPMTPLTITNVGITIKEDTITL